MKNVNKIFFLFRMDIIRVFDHIRNVSEGRQLSTLCINGMAYRLNCYVYLYRRVEHDRWLLALIRPSKLGVFEEIREIFSLRLYGCGDANPTCQRIHALCQLHGLEPAIECFANERNVSMSELCEKTNVLYSSQLVDHIHTFASHFNKYAVHSWPYSTDGNY
jgi:hypothetical protein